MTRFTRRSAIFGTFGVAAFGVVASGALNSRSTSALHGEDATPHASPDASPMARGMGMGGTGAAYMTIANAGTGADHLIGGSTTVAQVVEVHEIVPNDSGVMEMRPLSDGLEIPANGAVTLEPGGYHIMLIGLTEDLNADMTYELTLTFAEAGDVVVPVTVQRSAPEGDAVQEIQAGSLTISGAWSRPAPALLGDTTASPEAGHTS